MGASHSQPESLYDFQRKFLRSQEDPVIFLLRTDLTTLSEEKIIWLLRIFEYTPEDAEMILEHAQGCSERVKKYLSSFLE